MKAELKLQPMRVPNFVIAEMPPRSREQGMQEAPKFALSDLEANVLSGLCDEFRREVFEKAGKQDPQGKR